MYLVQFHRLLILGLLLSTSSAFAQTWNWAAQVATYPTGGFGANKATAITVDPNDNVYTIGDYGDSASFGGIKLKALSGADMFVAKLNSSGSYVWAKSFGSTSQLLPYGVPLTIGTLMVFFSIPAGLL